VVEAIREGCFECRIGSEVVEAIEVIEMMRRECDAEESN
jgi:hypothetical protein